MIYDFNQSPGNPKRQLVTQAAPTNQGGLTMVYEFNQIEVQYAAHKAAYEAKLIEMARRHALQEAGSELKRTSLLARANAIVRRISVGRSPAVKPAVGAEAFGD